MNWLVFALMTVVSWGVYGILLHTGQMGMKGAQSNPAKEGEVSHSKWSKSGTFQFPFTVRPITFGRSANAFLPRQSAVTQIDQMFRHFVTIDDC